jgi:hypothetical protein
MIIGFSKHGTGGGAQPIQYLIAETPGVKSLKYLLGERGKKGVVRDPAPAIVRGNPDRTQALIDSLRFKHRYTSGVLSFAPGERITPEMEASILDQFERVAFAGLDRSQYDILWVRHSHTSGGRHEVHFLIPRCELSTGKSLNIAPPRKSTRETFDTLRSKINAEFGLADPDDPARARNVKETAFRAKLQARERERIPTARRNPNQTAFILPNLKRAQELEARLEKLVENRSTYNQTRYPSLSIESTKASATEPVALPSLSPTYDRTGTPSVGSVQAPRIELPSARPSALEDARRFDEAAQRWSDALGNLERASEVFDGPARDTFPATEQEAAVVEPGGMMAMGASMMALLVSCAIPLRPRRSARDADNVKDTDFEPDMEMPYGDV